SGLAVAVAICNTSVDGIAVLETVEAASRLHRREKVRSRQGEAARSKQAARGRAAFTETEGISRVCLLGRNNPAPQPLIDELVARKSNGGKSGVIGDECTPHVESKATIAAGGDGTGERCFEGLPSGQCGAICECRAGKDR